MIKAVLFDWGSVLRSKTSWRRQKNVYSLASELRRRGVKTGILSNMYSMGAFIVRLLGDYRGFDPVILSCYEGERKPNPRIFQVAIKKLGFRPEEILFVDNIAENIKAASNLGMVTVQAKESKQVIDDIKEIITHANKLEL